MNWYQPIILEEWCRLTWISRATGECKFGGWSDAPRCWFDRVISASHRISGTHLRYGLETQWRPIGASEDIA
jgi:hypothetical protein